MEIEKALLVDVTESRVVWGVCEDRRLGKRRARVVIPFVQSNTL